MRTLGFALVLLTFGACSGDKDSSGTDATGETGEVTGDDDDDTSSIDAAGLYSSQCAACHGAGGEGGAVAPDPMSDYMSGLSATDIANQILNGGGSMPAVNVSQEEADAIAAWCLTEF